MKKYKAKCPRCGKEFEYTQKEIIPAFNIDEDYVAHLITLRADVKCPDCRLPLTIAYAQLNLIEYQGNDTDNKRTKDSKKKGNRPKGDKNERL